MKGADYMNRKLVVLALIFLIPMMLSGCLWLPPGFVVDDHPYGYHYQHRDYDHHHGHSNQRGWRGHRRWFGSGEQNVQDFKGEDMMMFQLKFLLFFLLSVPISACGHVISKEIRKDSDFSFTLRQVSQNPNTYQGKRVIFSKDFYLLALKM